MTASLKDRHVSLTAQIKEAQQRHAAAAAEIRRLAAQLRGVDELLAQARRTAPRVPPPPPPPPPDPDPITPPPPDEDQGEPSPPAIDAAELAEPTAQAPIPIHPKHRRGR